VGLALFVKMWKPTKATNNRTACGKEKSLTVETA
jgi:hypothetical protein